MRNAVVAAGDKPTIADDRIDPARDYDELDCVLDFYDPRRYGLMGFGTGAAVAIPEDVDIRDVLLNVERFYSHESCGKCTQCREGTAWTVKILERILGGQGKESDLDLLLDLADEAGAPLAAGWPSWMTLCVLAA